jgi:hypothetical protein
MDMAWTDACKIAAVELIKSKKGDSEKVRSALIAVSKETDIPFGTLKRWYYPETDYKPSTSSGTPKKLPISKPIKKILFDSDRKQIEVGQYKQGDKQFIVFQECKVTKNGKAKRTKNRIDIPAELIPQIFEALKL